MYTYSMSFGAKTILLLIALFFNLIVNVVNGGYQSRSLSFAIDTFKFAFADDLRNLSILEFGNQRIHDYRMNYPLFKEYGYTANIMPTTLIQTFDGSIITFEEMELNGRNVHLPVRDFFEWLGMSYTSVDNNGFKSIIDRALIFVNTTSYQGLPIFYNLLIFNLKLLQYSL